MRFPGTSLTEQTEQKFRGIRDCLKETSRERLKSAPYLRLKNSKRTSKCQSILFYGTGKTQKLNRIGAPEGTL